MVVFSLLGVLATPLGWIASEAIFLGPEELKNDNPLLAEAAELNRSPYLGVFQATQSGHGDIDVLGVGLSGPRLVFDQISRPFFAIFGGSTTTREFLYFALGGIWSMLVWSFAGLGVARVCLLRLTRNERAGLNDAFEYAVEFFPTSFSALGLPILAVFLLCVPTFLIGLLMGADFGAMLVGLVWILVLMIAFLLGLLLLGLLASWPLVIVSVAAEGQNAFDAVTRAFAYVFQRPVHYIFYAFVAIVFGGIVWLVAFQFTDAVIRLSYWSTGWGANRVNANRMDEVKGISTTFRDEYRSDESWISKFQDDVSTSVGSNVEDQPLPEVILDNEQVVMPPDPAGTRRDGMVEVAEPETGTLHNARRFIYFWIAFAKTVAVAFIHGLFWCMASAVYLLLRKDVDDTEMDEIYVIEERRTYDLPPLQSDEHGIPQIQPLPMHDESDID